LLILTNDTALSSFANSYFSTHLNRLEQNLESENDRILRGELAQNLCRLDKEFAKSLATKFKEFEKTDPDMRLAIALSASITFKKLDILMEKYRLADNDEDKSSIIRAMGLLPESELDKVMNLIETGGIKKQDSREFYISAAFCPYNRAYILKNFQTIVKEILKVFAGSGKAGMVIQFAVPYIGLNKEFEIKNILNKFKDIEVHKEIEKSLEMLKIYSKLIRQND
jgi:hypothetical protein